MPGWPVPRSGPSPRDACVRLLRVSAVAQIPVPSPRVRLLTKPGCHLCDDARAVISAVCEELGETFDEVDIRGDTLLMSEFGEQIPVTFVDGRQHDFWRADADRLRCALGRRP